MKKVYIAGPYTAGTREGVEENVRWAEAASWWFHQRGYAVHCPHSQSHYIHTRYNIHNMISYEQWLEADIAWINVCDMVAFLPDWGDSNGARMEHIVAQALGKKIYYISEQEIQDVLNQ